MKLPLGLILLFVSCTLVLAETEEKVSKRFTVKPGGKLDVNVDFGSIEVTPSTGNEVVVDVVRKVTRGDKADEEEFLRERPLTFSQDGNTVTVHSRAKTKQTWSFRGRQRTEGKYTISVPAEFDIALKTAGGGIAVTDIKGDINVGTSGGGLKLTRLGGPVNGHTSGGGIRVADCNGDLKIHTSGGGIDVAGGSGTLTGETSGGSVTVKNFRGPAQVETSGGGISIENVTGKVKGSTSGGSISATFPTPLADEVSLETSGGGVTVRLADKSAFDLDASTSGGGVSSELPVETTGKPRKTSLKGPVNGGGKPVLLRTSGGSIQVKKLKT